MKLAKNGRKKVRLYKKIQELGLSKFESKYYVKEAYSYKGRLSNKNISLTYLIYDTEIKRPKDIKIKRIREMFKKSELVSNLSNLNLKGKDIENYLDHYTGNFSPEKFLLEEAIEKTKKLGLKGEDAKKKIDYELEKNLSNLVYPEIIF